MRLVRDVESVVEALDRRVLPGIGDRLRQCRRELIDLRHEWQYEGSEHRDEADHEPREDDGRGQPATQAPLQLLDQRIERDGQERRGQHPHEDVAHAAEGVADEAQHEQPDDDLCDRLSGHVDRQPAEARCSGPGEA